MPSWFEVVKLIAVALAAYYGTLRAIDKRLAEIETKHTLLANDVKPVLTWWNRIAQNAADRLFIKTRAADNSGGN